MEWLSISLIGLLSTIIFTSAGLYLTHIRHKRALNLTFVRAPLAIFPDVALTNDSKSDLIVTSVSYVFCTPGKYLTLAQETDWPDPNSLPLSSGKGVRTRITFKNPFDAKFIRSGVYDRPNDCFVHSLYLSVEWVRNDGKPHHASVHVRDVGIESDGRIKYCTNIPQALSYDLYKVQKRQKQRVIT